MLLPSDNLLASYFSNCFIFVSTFFPHAIWYVILKFFIMNIFVAKLNYSTTQETVEELFGQFGQVDSAKIIFDRDTGRSKGFGFVEMPNADEANEAISSLNDTEVDGRSIVVKEAEERPRNNDRRGGGGFNRDRRY